MRFTLYNKLIPVRALPLTTIAIDGDPQRIGDRYLGIFANEFRTVGINVVHGRGH
jgi:hypothetical protein